MADDRWALGVDVGTSRSAGAMANGVVSPLEVEGNRWMPSMVLLDQSGTLVVGSAADYQAGVYPDRVERTPKRYIGGNAPLLLGGTAVEVEAAIARLIRVFIDEGKLRHGGRPPVSTVLTHPVRWGDDRKNALVSSARLAGLDKVTLIEEPVAAAVHYVGDRVEVGQFVGVYDLGGGTFDTAVLRRTADGFESVGAPGGDEFIGGEHFDHMIYEYLGTCLADIDADLWEQIQYGEERKWTRAAADLLTQARRAKEAVSSFPTTQVLLPLVDRDIVITRGQVEDMIRPLIEDTVAEMATTIESAGLQPGDLAAIYLVGGSSRIPLVTEQMTLRFGDRIATRDEPKSVVALGAASFARLVPLARTNAAPHARPAPQSPGRVGHGPPPQGRPAGPRPGAGPAPAPAPGPAPTPASAGARPLLSASAPSQLSRAWGLDLGAQIHGMSVLGNDLHVTLADGSLHRIDARGAWQWKVQLPGVAYGAPVAGPGTIHVGCANNQVVTLDAATGRERWRANTQAAVVAPPALAADLVVAADDNTMVAAFSWQNASLRWLLPLGVNVRAPIAVAGPSLLIAGLDGRVFRADVASGSVAWAFPAPDPVKVRPLVLGDVVILATEGGYLYGVDINSGRPHWGARVDGPIDGEVAVWDRYLLVADRSGKLSALTRTDGKVQWSIETGGTNPTGVVVNRSIAYLDNGANELVAVDLTTAEVKDRMKIQSGAWQTPIVTNDLVVVPSSSALVGVRTS